MRIFLLLLLSVATVAGDTSLRRLDLDIKDSAKIHALLAKSRRIQDEMDRVGKEFAARNNCPTTVTTLNELGFLACGLRPEAKTEPEKPKPAAPAQK